MATPQVSADLDVVQCEISIYAPPERVFQALTSPREIEQWWRNDKTSLEGIVLEPRVGGRWGYQTKQNVDGANKFQVKGAVLEYDPPRVLSYTWIANLHEDPARRTVVRWELTPIRRGTRVKLIHSGLAQEQKARQGYSNGWPDLIQRLRGFAEQETKGGVMTGAAIPRTAPNADEIVSEIHIAAPPERVFQALVDPAQVLKWWGQGGIYRATDFQSDLRVGGKWRSAGVNDAEGRSFEAHGDYLEIDRPRLLVHSWIASWTGDVKTTVRWELEATNQGTLVRIRHMGLAAHPELGKSYSGWPRLLGWLQALLERGETVEDRKPFSA